MDFILSLAHFCEIHGPTTVLCTQALPIPCSICLPVPDVKSPAPTEAAKPTSPTSKERRLPVEHGAVKRNGDRCASCCMSVPDQADHRKSNITAKDALAPTPLRTQQLIHTCKGQVSLSQEKELQVSSSSQNSNCSDPSCHTHSLNYVSNSDPAKSEAYSTLRQATVRTLSGEQLPRGQTSGPLWFGDPRTGYTIAYKFRLADSHARGRQRYYALIALAGSDTKRAFEACALIWSYFEKLARNIIETAEDVAAQSSTNDSPPERGQVTPISSFLTGRAVDPDGYPRGGAANIRPNGIAELMDNDQFFCELHIMFVSILQDLGRMLGGLKVVPANTLDVETGHSSEQTQMVLSVPQDTGNGNEKQYPALIAAQLSTPLCKPALVMHRQEVTV